MKKIIIVAITAVVVLVIVFCSILHTNKQEKHIAPTINALQITEFNLDNRVCLKTQDAIYVGNNVKEIDNNFCDIKIQNTQAGVTVEINKLWYESYGKDYIQDEYLAKICRELIHRLNVQNGDEQLEYILYKYIKDNYIKVRQNGNVEEILTDKINLKLELEEDIVKLKIRGN